MPQKPTNQLGKKQSHNYCLKTVLLSIMTSTVGIIIAYPYILRVIAIVENKRSNSLLFKFTITATHITW